MGMNLKHWGLATENEYSLNRVGKLAFTRSEAERLRDQWAVMYPNAKPLFVVNLKAE